MSFRPQHGCVNVGCGLTVRQSIWSRPAQRSALCITSRLPVKLSDKAACLEAVRYMTRSLQTTSCRIIDLYHCQTRLPDEETSPQIHVRQAAQQRARSQLLTCCQTVRRIDSPQSHVRRAAQRRARSQQPACCQTPCSK